MHAYIHVTHACIHNFPGSLINLRSLARFRSSFFSAVFFRFPAFLCSVSGTRLGAAGSLFVVSWFRPFRVSRMHPFVRVWRGSVSRYRFVVPFRGSVSCTFVVPFRVAPFRRPVSWFGFVQTRGSVSRGSVSWLRVLVRDWRFQYYYQVFFFPTVSPLMLFYAQSMCGVQLNPEQLYFPEDTPCPMPRMPPHPPDVYASGIWSTAIRCLVNAPALRLLLIFLTCSMLISHTRLMAMPLLPYTNPCKPTAHRSTVSDISPSPPSPPPRPPVLPPRGFEYGIILPFDGYSRRV